MTKSATEAAAAAAIPDPAEHGSGKVRSGRSTPLASVAEIKAGQTVAWKGTSDYARNDHFEPPFTNPEDARAVPPEWPEPSR